MSGHAHAPHGEPENKRVALVISVLALFLAIAEILGQQAQTHTLQSNIEASNLWAFFQAKTIRKSLAETAADEMETMLGAAKDGVHRKAMEDRIARFRATAARMESEPDTKEGRRELMARAKEAEHHRDHAGHKHHKYELASGSFQIAIVLASAMIITGIAPLLWGAGTLGAVGLIFLVMGLLG
jgi:hypothetical protein